MRSVSKTVLGITVMLGVLAGVALAQDNDSARDSVRFSARAGAAFTDNRDSVGVNEEDNTDFFIAPRVDAYLQSPLTVLDLYYEAILRHRTDPSIVQNDEDLFHNLGAKLRHKISERVALRAEEYFRYSDDPSVEEGGFTIREDRSYMLNRATVGARLRASEFSYADVSGLYEIKRYDDSDVADTSDEDLGRVQLMLWKQVAQSVAVFGVGSLATRSFEEVFDIKRDFDTTTAAVGLEKVFNPELRAGMRAGAQVVSYDDDALDSETFPYGELEVRYSPSPGARVTGAVSHGVRDADVFPFATQEYTEFKARGEFEPAPSVTIGVAGTYRMSDYEDESLPELGVAEPLATVVPTGDETTVVLRADVTVDVMTHSRIRVAQVFEDVDSDVEVSFTKNTSTVEYEIDF